MRLYTFANMYLSPIQMGIQSAHLLGELVNQVYSSRSVIEDNSPLSAVIEFSITMNSRDRMFCDWCEEHKTMIVCNGGNSKSLDDLSIFFSNPENPYPYAEFCEDEDSLNGALTCVGIVLPKEIFEAKKDFAPIDTGGFIEIGYIYIDDEEKVIRYAPDTYMYNLITRVKSARLA